MRKQPKELPPVPPLTHNCPIQGPDTEYMVGVDNATGERTPLCTWCEITKKFKP